MELIKNNSINLTPGIPFSCLIPVHIKDTISDIENGSLPQLVVPAGAWFASSVKESHSYSLVGCTVSPGFDFKDFDLADRELLISEYPQHQKVIQGLTR